MPGTRDPFAIETADGFPVLHSGPVSRAHTARGSVYEKAKKIAKRNREKNLEILQKIERMKGNGIQ